MFPGIQGEMLGEAVFGRLLKINYSPHGSQKFILQSWRSDEGVNGALAEQAVAHVVGGQVEQCCALSDVLECRRGRSWRRGAHS